MKYELSLTKDYVTNWTMKEAVRELLQNAIDSSGEMVVKYKDGILSIINKNTTIPVECLLLGKGSKRNDDTKVGKYGEGLPLALLVLTRENFGLNINNGDKIWVTDFAKSKTFNEQVLCIKELKGNEHNKDLIFSIQPISNKLYEELKKEFPCIDNDFGETIECDTGNILLDKRFSGKMFVEGLYIQEDNSFEHGYNFKSDVVKLDRDRKAINYYELRTLTAKSLVTAKECNPEIFDSISGSVIDSRDIIKVIDQASDEFLEEYSDMFYKKKNATKGTLVATEGTAKQLRKMNVNFEVIQGTEIESYLIAKANDQLDLIKKAEKEKSKKTDLENAAENYMDSLYAKIKRLLYKRRNDHDIPKYFIEEINEILDDENYAYGQYDIECFFGDSVENINKDFDWSISTLKKMIDDKIKEEEN